MILGNVDIDDCGRLAQIKSTESVAFNFMKCIAEVLQNLDPNLFVKNFKTAFVNKNNGQHRIYSDYVTGVQFEKLCKMVKTDHPGICDPTVLAIGLTMDSTSLNSSKSRTATPLCFYILNELGTS